MPIAFSRSMRSLHADGRSRSVIWFLLIPVAVLAGWSAWFVQARVARYEVTDRARLEVEKSVYAVQSPVAGRVISNFLTLDREVAAGELLVEIETAPERLQLQESKTRLAVLDPQIKAIQDEITAQQTAQQEDRSSAEAALDQARAQYRDAEAQAQLAATEAERSAKLRDQKLVAERELTAAQAAARSRRAAADAMQAAVAKGERDLRRSHSDREADIQDLHSQLEQLEGQRLSLGRTVERLSYEITRRRIVAPAAGRLGEVATLRPGAYVGQGDKLAVIVPSGELRIIAEFPPPAALGRIRPGQPARLRLEGFPWTQFGAVPAHVTHVGGEVRDGYVRVELAVDRHDSSIPLQHGLPGSVEVQIENVSPATLLLRSAGHMVGATKSPYDRPTP